MKGGESMAKPKWDEVLAGGLNDIEEMVKEHAQLQGG